MTKLLTVAALAILLELFQPLFAQAADLKVNVSISSQTMTVVHRGKMKYRWKVSTAREGKITPMGSWRAKWLSRDHRSSLYGDAPMPYAIFYNGDYAIHGTNQVRLLGKPASVGCVRLRAENAAILYRLVQKEGLGNMRIVVQK